MNIRTSVTIERNNPMGIAVVVIGAIIAIVPIFIYRAYETMPDMVMQCFATAQAEIAVGSVLAVIGVFYFLSKNQKVRLISSVLVAVLAALSLLFPTNWTNLCADVHMSCHMITLPVLIVSAILLWVFAALGIVFSLRKQKSE